MHYQKEEANKKQKSLEVYLDRELTAIKNDMTTANETMQSKIDSKIIMHMQDFAVKVETRVNSWVEKIEQDIEVSI